MNRVRCIANGVTVSGIPAARSFVPGDVIDLDAVCHGPSTWRDALGRFVTSHFEPVDTVEKPTRNRRVPPAHAEGD